MKRLLFIFLSLVVFSAVHAKDLYEVTANRLNVRVSPSTYATILGVVTKGETIEVLEIKKSIWAEFEYKGKIGYVSTKYIKFVRHIEDAPIVEEIPEPEVEENVIEEQIEVVQEQPAQPTICNTDFTTLINGPFRIKNDFELYYGISAGAGYSTFKWTDGMANGKLCYTADLFAQLYLNNAVGFLPKGYFTELQLGYDCKGAAWYPQSYAHARIYPFGYKLMVCPIQFCGKLGAYLGFPLSDLESYNSYETWTGNFQAGLSASIGAEYHQYGMYANVEYNVTEISSYTRVSLHNFAVFITLSYKFGKLKH